MNKAQDFLQYMEKKTKSKSPGPDRPGTKDTGKWIKNKGDFHVWLKEYLDGTMGTITKLKNKKFKWELGLEVDDSDREAVKLAKGATTDGTEVTQQGAENASDEAYRKWRG